MRGCCESRPSRSGRKSWGAGPRVTRRGGCVCACVWKAFCEETLYAGVDLLKGGTGGSFSLGRAPGGIVWEIRGTPGTRTRNGRASLYKTLNGITYIFGCLVVYRLLVKLTPNRQKTLLSPPNHPPFYHFSSLRAPAACLRSSSNEEVWSESLR